MAIYKGYKLLTDSIQLLPNFMFEKVNKVHYSKIKAIDFITLRGYASNCTLQLMNSTTLSIKIKWHKEIDELTKFANNFNISTNNFDEH